MPAAFSDHLAVATEIEVSQALLLRSQRLRFLCGMHWLCCCVPCRKRLQPRHGLIGEYLSRLKPLLQNRAALQ
ncbi:hypothetical protein [Xanthomonas translucens]|uniref:hypothetical protein n=1 Tax=Xanthomonas campestris pv. translucens TaxID=343 RepID=UPI001F514EB0|nr:hypothetical protein [Xanthomonas translucens]